MGNLGPEQVEMLRQAADGYDEVSLPGIATADIGPERKVLGELENMGYVEHQAGSPGQVGWVATAKGKEALENIDSGGPE